RRLAFGEVAEVADAFLNNAQDFFIQPAGAFLAVAGDEGDGIFLVEQLDDRLDLHLADLQILGDPRQVQVSQFSARYRRGLLLNALRHDWTGHFADSPVFAPRTGLPCPPPAIGWEIPLLGDVRPWLGARCFPL